MNQYSRHTNLFASGSDQETLYVTENTYQNSSKVLAFKDKPIQSSTSLYKQSFGIQLVRPSFLAYDFECILKKMNNNEVNQKTTYTLIVMNL
ncbi:hypothetical protein PROFUN_14738 [Planoprotostelium fungivorum]|uniref:Uncharacterized protein n=1 Tax=Planoprotostelium fungivorum TaxID=1890364 RepID=A0A2P6MXW9_9EUKA|nr:hypothetical protein PROFUN_14738 [Planoprotostelium fungivorum]